jgi:hypothetical protein
VSAFDQVALRRGLAKVFVDGRACRDALDADVAAGAVAAALQAAVEHWVREGGAVALRHFLTRAWNRLERLGQGGEGAAPPRRRRAPR